MGLGSSRSHGRHILVMSILRVYFAHLSGIYDKLFTKAFIQMSSIYLFLEPHWRPIVRFWSFQLFKMLNFLSFYFLIRQ